MAGSGARWVSPALPRSKYTKYSGAPVEIQLIRAFEARHSVLAGIAISDQPARTRTESGLNFSGKSASTHTGRPLGVESACRKRRKLAVGQRASPRSSILTEAAMSGMGAASRKRIFTFIGRLRKQHNI